MRILWLWAVVLAACGDAGIPPIPDSPPPPCPGGCKADEYCVYDRHDCGQTGGSCQPRPTTCPADGPPVCVCGGAVYASECAAAMDGKDDNLLKQCDLPDGKFRCGYEVCDLATQYCQSLKTATEFSNTCTPLPAACTDGPSCTCLATERCGTMSCTGDPATGITLTCMH